MNVRASGRTRLTSSATELWAGPMTTASASPVPFGAAASTCASSDRPATGFRTFGTEDRMRVPSPAASTTVRLDRAVIRILHIGGDNCAGAVIKRFCPPWKPDSPPRLPWDTRAGSTVNVCRVIRRPGEVDSVVWLGIPTNLAGGLDTENTGGLLTGFL